MIEWEGKRDKNKKEKPVRFSLLFDAILFS
jgi:hypothetical protein